MMENTKNNLFQLDFYANKPHWTTDYYDVLSGCKDSFIDYRNKILGKSLIQVNATFTFDNFENATFRINYSKYGILAFDLAYIKLTDTNNVLKGNNFKELYYFVKDFKFLSSQILEIDCSLDYWMTFWPYFKFNGNSLLVQRKHFPRYRTDDYHLGEYDFSTNSVICNIDNIETTFTNLVTTSSYTLYADNDIEYQIPKEVSDIQNYAYAFVLPNDSDSVGYNNEGQLKWIKVKDLKDGTKSENISNLNFLNIDNSDYGLPQGSPFFVFSVSNNEIHEDTWNIIDYKNPQNSFYKKTYDQYPYQILSSLGSQRIASLQVFEHPIFNFQNKLTDRLLYINGVSEWNKSDLNVREIVGLSSKNLKLRNWKYKIRDSNRFFVKSYYKPFKKYSENDELSLDQEPALFRTPHFEFEYSIYSCKATYIVYNELLLSKGYFNDYGNLFCDYILHLNTHLKYIYVQNGWYEEQRPLWKFGLFEENIYNFDLLTDAYSQYMQQSMYRYNTSVNQTKWNMYEGISKGFVEGGFAIAAGALAAPFTGGASLLAGAAFGANSIYNSAKSGIFTLQQMNAQLKDLQRSPSTIQNLSNSFSNSATKQMLGGSKKFNRPWNGILVIRQHRKNEQWILYWHFHQYGYLVNKRMNVKDLSWFYSRTWFDYFMIEDFSNVVNQTEYSQMILNKFNNIFKRGIRMWHTIDNFLNYEKNNKEIADWKKIHIKN